MVRAIRIIDDSLVDLSFWCVCEPLPPRSFKFGAANWARSDADAADLYSTGRGFLDAHRRLTEISLRTWGF